MTQDRIDLLDAEERALAAQLPRVRGRSEPTADMDARILAAARAAQAAPPARRGVRRWPVPFALAASLCLAVGLAWQLRLAPSRHAQVDATRPAASPVTSSPVTPQETAATPRPTATATPMTQPQAEAGRAPPSPTMPRPPMPVVAGSAVPEAPVAQPVVIADQAQYAPAPPPPAPAPVMAPTPAASAFPAEANAKASGTLDARAAKPAARSRLSAQESTAGSAPAPAATPAPAAARAFAAPAPPPPSPHSTAKQAALSAQGSGVVAQDQAEGENDEPPATMNSPSAREAWLRRITELVRQGRNDDARASLAEFCRRYPNERIPAALRALEHDPPR